MSRRPDIDPPAPDGPLPPRTPDDPLNPDPGAPDTIPLPPDSLPQPRSPGHEPDPPPSPDASPIEPTRLRAAEKVMTIRNYKNQHKGTRNVDVGLFFQQPAW